MKEEGFYREMRIAGDDAPSMRPGLGTVDGDAKRRIVAYLSSGHGLVMSPTSVDDGLDPARTLVAPLGVLTDGEFVWPAELAYYVETYDLGVSAVFARHMAANGWEVPAIDREALTDMVRDARSPEE